MGSAKADFAVQMKDLLKYKMNIGYLLSIFEPSIAHHLRKKLRLLSCILNGISNFRRPFSVVVVMAFLKHILQVHVSERRLSYLISFHFLYSFTLKKTQQK